MPRVNKLTKRRRGLVNNARNHLEPAVLLNHEKLSANAPTGRRILTTGSWINSLNIAANHGKTCRYADVYFEKEIRVGLRSRLQVSCNSCSWKEWICNDQDEPDVTLPINRSLIWGTNAGGSHFEAVKELFTVMDIPFPSHSYFFRESEKVIQDWDKTLLQNVTENGKAEAKAAEEAGEVVTVDGIVYPSTSVYVDGGWSTRSYGHSCKSKGGVAVIIGARTNKLLHIGIKNMFCIVCKRSSNSGKVPGKHTCYKNWDESVSATNMESQIILEGFQSSLESHGLVYETLIGDGDSSVYSTLLNSAVYPGVSIDKVECVNHMLKNLNKSLIKLANDTSIPIQHRKLLKARHSRIGKSVRSAINYRNKNNRSNHLLLRKDILNVPHHTFGNHENCDEYFCSKPTEQNLVSELHRTIMWHEIFQSINRVAFSSSRLIQNLTSNLPESCMSRVAKYNHGKRLNVIQRFGWHGKSTAAALAFSKGKTFYVDAFKALTGTSPSRKWAKAQELARKSISRVRNHDLIRKNRFVQKMARKSISDIHYGPNAAAPDIDDEAMTMLIHQLTTNLQVTLSERDVILYTTSDQAGSDEWAKQRRHRMTASVAGDIFSLKDQTPNEGIVKRILYAKKIDHLNPIQHGKAFEKDALEAYKNTTGNNYTSSGLHVSMENGIFAASPDGLVGDDGLVEVKCPYVMIGRPPQDMPEVMKTASYLKPKSKHDPTLELNKSHKHYRQVVMQLHVTGRDWCDFVVYTFRLENSVKVDFKPFIQRIWRNAETTQLWELMKIKLTRFFEQDLAPEIANSRFKRKLPIRQPQYRQNAMKQAESNSRKTSQGKKKSNASCA